MSEADQREWRFYIADMIGFAERVLSYTDGLDRERFVDDCLVYDATVRNLELIGEAAIHVPDALFARRTRRFLGDLSSPRATG